MTESARHAAAMAHADQVFASAEKQVDYLVGCMNQARAEDAGCSRVEHWLPLVYGLTKETTLESASHFLAAAILRLSEASNG